MVRFMLVAELFNELSESPDSYGGRPEQKSDPGMTQEGAQRANPQQADPLTS
jgi:hypothetical protein